MKKETHIVFVLDSSSSMQSCKSAIIEGYNSEVEHLKAHSKLTGGDVFVSLVVFGEWVDNNQTAAVNVKYTHRDIEALMPLNPLTYLPSGNTPMLDGIGEAIRVSEQYDTGDGDIAFLVCTFTDGQENASKVWVNGLLPNKIDELQKKGNWTFTFTGANVNLRQIHNMTNIHMNNMMAYASTDAGTRKGMQVNSMSGASYLGYRGAGGQSVGGVTQDGFFDKANPLTTNPPVVPSPIPTPPAYVTQLPPKSKKKQEKPADMPKNVSVADFWKTRIE